MKLAEFRKRARALEAEPDGERRAELAKQLYERFGRSWIEKTSLRRTHQQPAVRGTNTREFTFKKVPSRNLRLFVDFPTDWQRDDKRTAIVFWHGGGFMHGDAGEFFLQSQYFAKRGAVVVRPEYRIRDIDTCTPIASVEDGISALRFVNQRSAEFGIDPNRIVVGGGSAGGCIASATATIDNAEFANLGFARDDKSIGPSPEPCAMLLFNPYVDFFDVYNQRQHWEECAMVGQDPVAAEPLLHMISAIENLRHDSPASLIMAGTRDPFFPQQLRWVARCVELDLDVREYIYQDQVHGWFNSWPHIFYTTESADQFLVDHRLLPPLKNRKKALRAAFGGVTADIPKSYAHSHVANWEQNSAVSQFMHDYNITPIDPPNIRRNWFWLR